MIESKPKKMLSEWEKIKVHTKLVLEYQKRNDHKIFNRSAKQIAIGADIDEAFKSMHQSIMKKRLMLEKTGLS